jgi:hypothetical protein
MKCGFSKEILALYVEDDLAASAAINSVESHIERCPECLKYCDDLRKSQSFIHSRFRMPQSGPVSQEMLAGVRRTIMSQIEPTRQSAGWALRLERFLVLGLRRPRYAAIGIAVIAIVSASLLGQIRHATQASPAAAVFSSTATLLYPSDYRDWVVVGSDLTHHHAGRDPGNVYMSPASYSEYKRTGNFPDGTVLVLEAKQQAGIQVSVKDSSRFEDGWGFYDFRDGSRSAEALPESTGCRSCHGDKAASDHVFTQYYPVLRSGTAL